MGKSRTMEIAVIKTWKRSFHLVLANFLSMYRTRGRGREREGEGFESEREEGEGMKMEGKE